MDVQEIAARVAHEQDAKAKRRIDFYMARHHARDLIYEIAELNAITENPGHVLSQLITKAQSCKWLYEKGDA